VHSLRGETGSISGTASSWSDGGFGKTSSSLGAEQDKYYRDLNYKANSVSLLHIFGVYGVKVVPGSSMMTCPFKFHKGGRERTPSFEFYSANNTFWCHGCANGVRPVDFVAKMDGISKTSAAHKILSLFGAGDYGGDYADPQDAGETLELMVGFSNLVRGFRDLNTGEKAEEFIEGVCKVYDGLCAKHNLENDGLRSLLEKCRVVVENWRNE